MNRLLNRILIIEAFVVLCLLFGGCTFNRNAPLIDTHITANGNTVPVSAVP